MFILDFIHFLLAKQTSCCFSYFPVILKDLNGGLGEGGGGNKNIGFCAPGHFASLSVGLLIHVKSWLRNKWMGFPAGLLLWGKGGLNESYSRFIHDLQRK